MKSLTLLGAVAFFAACEAPTAPTVPTSGPNAAVLQNDRTETAAFAFNNCSGEVIAGTATFHDVFAITTTPSGTFHLKVHENASFEGSSGTTEYVASQEINETENLAAGEEITEVIHFNLVSKGSAPNEVLQESFHITITPDGDVTSSHDNFFIKCTG
jgi:hypothetical protein